MQYQQPRRAFARLASPAALLTASLLVSPVIIAGPTIPAGDTALRNDIQTLADHGIISGSVSTWPLSWAPIARDVNAADPTQLPSYLADTVLRVRARAEREAPRGELLFKGEAGAADNRPRIRGFEDTPRGRGELSAGAAYFGEHVTADLNLQYVDAAEDGDDVRLDESLLAVQLGNWSLGASTQDRWWGPGWDGSLILSNNARPFPSLVFDRVTTDAFASKWLSWMGPWDLAVMFGQLEEERVVPNARFFGMRATIRPFQSLEIGFSRTAQWCGDDRPCGFDTFWDLFWGRDNRGDAGIGDDNEPGNQLAGFDVRWNPAFLDRSMAFYVQLIGEDEAGFFPSRYLGQFGLEWSAYLNNRWSTRFFAEYAGTTCQFHEDSSLSNCAYNHGIYQTGYRYKGRVIGHGADNDADLYSAGLILVDPEATEWRVLLRLGELNNEGGPDSYNELTATEQIVASIDIAHARVFSFGSLELGLGYEQVEDAESGTDDGDARAYLQWRSH